LGRISPAKLGTNTEDSEVRPRRRHAFAGEKLKESVEERATSKLSSSAATLEGRKVSVWENQLGPPR